jgi:group II intron reverse transcriptase/maturase
VPSRLVPPRWDPEWIRFVPCQHALYRSAKADPGRRFHALRDKVYRRDVLWRAWVAVRRNDGAPGIDAITLAEVEEYGVDRLLDELAEDLRNGRWRPRPARRVFIPKPGTTEQRPLSIPSVRDRIVGAALKIVLEPIFEADFLPCSFGFRPKRSAHDALQVLIDESWRGRRWVVETDIADCFGAIPHEELMRAVEERVCDQGVLRLLRVMLRAGVMQDGRVRRPVTGTPQGGVVSPLLANIALHGLETAIRAAFPPSCTVTTPAGGREVVRNWQPAVIRYADDFVVLHEDRAVIEQATALAAAWLADMGLALHPSKTRLTHTLTPIAGAVGFDFLGFTVRQFPVGKTHSGKRANGTTLGFKTIIRPSKAAQQHPSLHCKAIVRRHQNAPQAALVARLNPVIRGWSRYYAAVAAKAVFTKMDHLLWLKLRRWAKRRHPRQRATRWVARYWHRQGARTWSFSTKEGHTLLRHADTPLVRYPKVQNTRSPYDGDWSYWATRLGHHPALSAERAMLLRKQRGTCPPNPWIRREE